jgi:hypothetical protein
MIRLLFMIPLCALASSQATAQNEASQILLALSEDERNAAVTGLLRESNEKCDRVIRTLFKGTELGLDEWEALCHDRNSYSFIMCCTVLWDGKMPPGVLSPQFQPRSLTVRTRQIFICAVESL